MDRHPNDLTTDEEIDAAIEQAKEFASFPRIVEAAYRGEPGLEFLMLKLSDGRRLLIPREELGELKNATLEQATEPTGWAAWPGCVVAAVGRWTLSAGLPGTPLGQTAAWGRGVEPTSIITCVSSGSIVYP